MQRHIGLLLAIFVLLTGSRAFAAEKPLVFVSILPQKYFVEKIAGDLMDVSVMVMPGASPATYEPSPKQMADLEKSKAYFSIGVPFEATWLKRFAGANPKMTLIRTDSGITKRPMVAHHHHEKGEHHSDHEAPAHGILDPHVWLAPEQVRTVAKNICDGLIQVDGAHKADYEANLQSFLKEIDSLDAKIKQILAPLPKNKRIFMVFHPSWGYFAKEYGLKQIPIESEGKEPSPKELVEIVQHGRKLGIPVVFVQPQFSDKSAKVIASEMGAKVVPLNPLAEDWAANLLKVAEAFQSALQ